MLSSLIAEVRIIRLKHTVWIVFMISLCIILFIIVDARRDNSTELIFGGTEGGTIKSDYIAPAKEEDDKADELGGLKWPDIDITEHQYSIVNDDNLLSAVYYPDVEVIDAGYVTYYGTKYDTETMPYLIAMLDAVREAGYSIYVNSGYRSYSYQEQIFNGTASSIAEQMGITGKEAYLKPEYQEAVEKARHITGYPGASEHQLGLAVDLVDRYRGTLRYDAMDQDMFAWLDAHCCEYGFIKRYPSKKLLLTGWDESWHYRYVGVEAATFIMQNDLCYEQFYAHYDPEFTY